MSEFGDGKSPRSAAATVINDIMHFGKKAHVVTSNWKVNVAPAVAARAIHRPPISWTAIWMKAISLVGERRDELRTAYIPYPWAHFYVHPHCHCAVVIERTWRSAPAVFFDVFEQPDRMTLAELDSALRNLKQAPVKACHLQADDRRRAASVLLRRLLWHQLLYWGSGNLRAQLLGTFAVNPFPTGGLITQTAAPISFFSSTASSTPMEILKFRSFSITSHRRR